MSQLVTLSRPRSAEAEAYRSLRTNLGFAGAAEPLRTLLMTSPGPQEGRSAVLANLAVAIAQSGRSVVVADCDLRRPRQHALFGVTNEEGLATLLPSNADADLPLRDTAVDGLRVLPSGPVPPNPAELLGSREMSHLIERVASDCDVALFDAPPVVAVTDAAVLAPQVDGVVLVLAAGRSRRDQTSRAREILETVGANVLGVVLTGVPPESTSYGEYAGDGE